MMQRLKSGGGLSSVVYIVLGAFLMIFPGTAANIIVRLIGVAALVYGIPRIISRVQGGGDTAGLVFSILVVVAGFVFLSNPRFLQNILSTVLGIYVIVEGINELRLSLNMRRMGYRRWVTSFCLSVAVTIVGIVILTIDPINVCVMVFGGALLVSGVLGLMDEPIGGQ